MLVLYFEAEFFISEICENIIWTVNLLLQLKCKQFIIDAVLLNPDNEKVIHWKECTKGPKSRYRELRILFVKYYFLLDNFVTLKFVQDENIVADFLAKDIHEHKLVYSVKNILINLNTVYVIYVIL